MKNNNVVKNDKKFNLNRPITGVIKKDRIWEQWYDPEKMKEKLPKMNQADYEEMCNKNYPNDIILNNRGLKKITNSEFINMRNKFIRSLKAMGIGKGDKVVSIALSTPELIAFKYACAYVGAITAHFNFMEDKDKMYKHIKLLNPSLIMFLDILEPNVCEVLNSEEFNNIKKLRLPVSASTPALNDEKFKAALFTLNNKLQNKSVKGAISLGKFVSYGQYYNGPMESVYEDHLPSNIALSSGTTGESKAILLSHDANNALAKQHEIADLGLKRGEKNLALVPPFLAFWDADIIGMAMSLGLENILEMDLSYESVPKYLAKHKPNYGIWSQYLWDSVLYDKNKDEYIGNLKKVVIGGERPDINQVNRFKSETGITQEAGFGASEMDSCFSVAHPNCNMIGSSGLPLPFNNVMIKDSSFNDLSYNEPGRIWITGPAMMNGYYNNPQMTDSVIYTDKDGVKWYNTKDFGFVHDTGSLFVLDRDQKPLEINSKEINLILIAEKIKELPCVKLCKLNHKDDKIVCHVSFDDLCNKTKEECTSELLNYIDNVFTAEERLSYLVIYPSLPRTPLGKVDYQTLDNLANNIECETIELEKNNIKVLHK